MKGRIFAIVFCVAVTSLIVSASSTGAANGPKAESAVVAGQADTQQVANGPKGIPPGWEKRVFVHYRNSPARPDGKGPKSGPQCYGFLARGVKWNNPADSAFYVDATNSQGLKEKNVLAAVEAAATTWSEQTTADILPSCLPADEPLEADWDAPDGSNEVVFGDLTEQYPGGGVIAVTIVWGIFGGPPGQRGIMEFDMVLDDINFDWSIGGSETTMDVQNIVTHELGHAVGLDDMYQSGCSEVTMYGYSTEGETKKCTLEPDDIAGLRTLYPPN
jgi:hypothetical protein